MKSKDDRPRTPGLRAIWIEPSRVEDWDAYPFRLPFVRGLHLEFRSLITCFVGENGSGKSTIVEAIRIAEVRLEETSHYRITRGILRGPRALLAQPARAIEAQRTLGAHLLP